MRRFLVQASSFVFLSAVLPIVAVFGSFWGGGRQMDFSMPGVTTLIVGDSTAQCGIDDSVLPNACNLAHGASSLPESFWRMRAFLAANPQVKKVLFVLRPGLYDERSGRNGFDANVLLKHLFLMDGRDFDRMGLTAYDYALMFQSAVTRGAKGAAHFWDFLLHPRLGYMGGFVGLKGSHLSKALERERRQGKKRFVNYAALESPYWSDLICLTKDHGAELVVVIPPLYQFDSRVDTRLFMKCVKDHVPADVRLLDYSRLTFHDDEWYDVIHLNGEGARKWTALIRKDMDGPL